ncbi:MAG: dihydroxyacetone kinase subunit L [Acidobacteria bacterium]|nr:dihydroxyacetone kinase subunit L [Acidobacteriota bacterium]
MPTTFTTVTLRDALGRIIKKLEASADELNLLDAQLGDGDLGVSLVRGARAVEAELPRLPDDVGMALLKCAQAFTKLSGSTYGTLLATGLMSAAKATKGRTEVAWSEVSSLLGNALQAMAQRSGGELGDKTVLDALDAARAATDGLAEPAALAAAADRAVAECLDRFRGQPARQGRARIFAEKSIGKDDPGAVAFKRMIEALNQDHSQ